jgi:two-component sensor histidine kinase
MTSIRELQDLLEDVRHRHRDDLQLISNLLDLQCETIRDEQSLRALKEYRSRIRVITLVYQRLLESEGWSRVDFADYLGRQLARLFQTYDDSLGAITSRISVEQARLDIDMAIPCGLIVNELVSNSLRHAFPEGRDGEILMEVSRGPKGEHRLVIGDNGVGFPGDLDFRQTETLGLQLVTLLVKQLDGTIELDRSHGTTFRITLFGPRSPHLQR